MDFSDLLVLFGVGYIAYLVFSQNTAYAETSTDQATGPIPPTTPTSNVVTNLANAIAQEEGFYVAGSIPQRQNNPGNLTVAGQITTYPTAAAGWSALYAQVQSMFDGTSNYYNPSMSLAQVGNIYAGGDPNWAANVASILGVSTSTTLNQLAGGS